MLARIVTHIGPDECVLAVGIAVYLDSTDSEAVARTPTPSNIVGAWCKPVAFIRRFHFQPFCTLSLWARTCHVPVVKVGDPGIGITLLKRKR